MRYTLIYDIELEDSADANAVLEEGAAWLEGEKGASIYSFAANSAERPFSVYGVIKGRPDERWNQSVMAQDPAQAEEKAKALADEGTERTVAVVLPGALAPSE
jgi:hypothetical protein